MPVTPDTLALVLADMQAQLDRLEKAVAVVGQEVIARSRTSPTPEAAPVVTLEPAIGANPDMDGWKPPTLEEYLAGGSLPPVTTPDDVVGVATLARVGRLANGERRRSWPELQSAYAWLEKLKAREVTTFAAVQPPVSWGAQMAITLLELEGWSYLEPRGTLGESSWKPEDFAGWGLADVGKAGVRVGLAGQG